MIVEWFVDLADLHVAPATCDDDLVERISLRDPKSNVSSTSFELLTTEMHARPATDYICHSCRHARSHVALQKRQFTVRAPSKAKTRAYSTRPRPLHLAIIGSGPAGFYAAYRLLKSLPNARVDMYEGLPSPYGLVRFGIAPDHPEAKVRIRHCNPKHSRIHDA